MTKKTVAKKATKAAPAKPGARKLPTIAEATEAFRLKEASARAAILTRLIRDLGKPVPMEALVKEVGQRAQMARRCECWWRRAELFEIDKGSASGGVSPLGKRGRRERNSAASLEPNLPIR